MTETGRLYWNGQFPDFTAFMDHTVIQRMGGTNSASTEKQIEQWIIAQPAPENANYTGTLTAAQENGRMAFAKAGCNTCHSGANFTDSVVVNNVLHDVGTGGTSVDETREFDTPSLKGLARSAPYLHDGKASTLLDRLNAAETGRPSHGDVAQLSDQDKLDLVEYLKTL